MKPTLALHKLPLYNTGRLDDADIIAAFSARKPIFDRIIFDLSVEKDDSRAQHHLVVGQRGMGKTMLLARIAAEIRTSSLGERFIPLVFAEEQYSVDRLSKFWLNCLDSLADAQDHANNQAEAAKIDTIVADLTTRLPAAAKDDAPLASNALEAFLTAAASLNRRPVLLVDNLQLVFERISEEQQHALREVLMRPGCPVLVGASPSPPPESQNYGAAFYDHFKVHYLRPLEAEKMKSLMLHLAEISDRPEVREQILSHPQRLPVLRQLTGGNPRTTATLFFLYAEDFAPSVFGDLENLLDRVTPLYKARFEELSPQQQVIASAIANHWDPVTSRTLAEMTGLPMTGISPQLDRLEKTGFIERVELSGKAATGFQIAERIFNVWFLMRSASRRQRREVELLTKFIENFYESQDRSRLAEKLLRERNLSPDRHLFAMALACTLDNRAIAEDLERHAQLDALSQKREDSLQQFPEAKDLISRLKDLSKSEAPDLIPLQEALSAAYDQNWGHARDFLSKALDLPKDGFTTNFHDGWMQASAVLLHLNYGDDLLRFLGDRGDHLRLRPWYEALRALNLGDRRQLLNIAPEIRTTAEEFYDQIERRLNSLPQSTRRRSLPKKKSKGKRTGKRFGSA